MKYFIRETCLKKIRGFYHAADLIKVIVGVRGCGKTSLMHSIADELKAQGVPAESIHLIDLESQASQGIKEGEALYEAIRKIERGPGPNYLFLDELQHVQDFELIHNGLRKTEDWSIFITGSHASLLDRKQMTRLTGRYLVFELFPLSFKEYIEMKRFYEQEISDNLLLELSSYIQEGGFPGAFFCKTIGERKAYIKKLLQDIFEKDIYQREHLNIRDKEKFEAFCTFMLSNYSSLLSFKEMKKGFEQTGRAISEATIAKYMRVLLDTKLLYECRRFDIKKRRFLGGKKKYYLSDLSLFFARNTENQDNRIDYGPALENLAYLYARAHDYTVSVGRDGLNCCDFIFQDHRHHCSYAQVCFTLYASKEEEDRIIHSLARIKDYSPKYILSTDQIFREYRGIEHVNLIDFMLKGRQF